LELLSVPKDEFNFDGRYVLIAESDTEKTSKEKIKSYISAYIQCFILITLIASLSHFSGKNEYNNPYYITLIVSFVGALILLSTGFLIFEIAMPKRTKLNNRKLERILNGFQFLDNIKDIPETYYRNYLCNIEWNITDQFNMYRSALIFTVKFKENDLPHDKIKLSNKRMSMGSDYIQYDLACGYYKLPDEDKIIKCLDEMIDLLSENCLHPISKEESDIMQAMAAIQQNEYDYREEHFYQ